MTGIKENLEAIAYSMSSAALLKTLAQNRKNNPPTIQWKESQGYYCIILIPIF